MPLSELTELVARIDGIDLKSPEVTKEQKAKIDAARTELEGKGGK